MNSLLILTDLTENSANAYRYAVELAGPVQAEVKLVYSTNGQALSVTDHLRLSQKLQSFAQRYACLAEQKTAVQPTECLISYDTWAKALPLLVNVHQPDLILAGSGVLDQLEEQQKTVPLAFLEQYPLLWVPEKATYQPIKNMAFVTDFTDQDPATIDQVKRFAGIFNAEVTLLHLYAAKDRERLTQIKKEGDLLHRLITPAGTPYFVKEAEDLVSGLEEFTRESPVDLFVMATRDTYLAHQYFKSGNEKVVAGQLAIPLLNLYQARKSSCAGNCTFCQKQHAITHAASIPL